MERRKTNSDNKRNYSRKKGTEKSVDKPEKRSYEKRQGKSFDKPERKPFDRNSGKSFGKGPAKGRGEKKERREYSDDIRLNKYIANSGISSRREADMLIKNGAVKVNGEIVTEMGHKIKLGDRVSVQGKSIKPEKPQYLLLNKPKDYITTTRDPQERKTVMDLIKGACKERVFPVGRLDRNTTGLLLFTNNGDLAKKLMHPMHKIKKVYHVTLDKNLERSDMLEIAAGPVIEEERIAVDAIGYTDGGKKNEVEIHLHSGQYHVVRKIFNKFNYKVNRLDRVRYGPFTKKNLPRGKWRFLTDDEINLLHRL